MQYIFIQYLLLSSSLYLVSYVTLLCFNDYLIEAILVTKGGRFSILIAIVNILIVINNISKTFKN